MIKKLQVKNYKSLKNVEIELDKFNVLIGPNASGKSNILDVLVFLSDLAKSNVVDAIRTRGNFEHIIFGGGGQSFEISLVFSLDNKLFSYIICINNRNGVLEEKLTVGNETVIERNETKGKLLRNDGALIPWQGSYNETALHQSNDEYFPLIQKAHDYLVSCKAYQIVSRDTRNEFPASRSFELDRSGSNLAQVLVSLHNERPKLFNLIEEVLKQGILEVDELITPLTEQGKTFIAIREKGFNKKFDYYQLSDGTIRLLAYITAMTLPESNVICFEEPENFMHPRLLQLLVEILKKSDKQIILSTHSPYFLDFVEPEDVRVVEKVNGETRVSKVSNIRRLKKYLKELGLGELWYSGEIGGVD